MEARPTDILGFLGKSQNFQFVVLVYQRMYSWDIEHCEKLWDDILRVGANDNVSMHFIGSIMYIGDKHSQTAINQLSVIDGQQRLTTLTLLLIALSNAICDDEILEKFSKTKIRNRYLINPDEKNEKRYKLILSQTDKDTLISIIDDKPQPQEISIKINQNFEFFKEKIQENKDSLEIICKGINKLSIIDISLDREKDEAQLIFESMNSTGKDLTQTDLMRNYILMDLEPQKQAHLYETYWREMERGFGQEYYGEKFDRFMRDYLTIKNNGKVPNLKKIYDSFKQYHRENDLRVENLLKELQKFAKYYCNMALKQEGDKELLNAFDDLSKLEADVVYPFLLRLYDDYKNSLFSKDDFIQIIKLTESYIFRRAVCGIPTNALNKVFANFGNSINVSKYTESVLARFCILTSNASFPNDELFKENLSSKELYMKFKKTNYLLSKLENFGRKERVDINEYTIEHIMPQNIDNSTAWQKELGQDYEQIHEKYLHSLGNLTLTGYNSEYSNKSFVEKRDMQGGFKESPLRLNDTLRTLQTFGENEIKSRANELANKALQIWQYPKIDKEILQSYKKEKDKRLESYTLDDHKFLAKNGKSRKLFDELRKGILALDEGVREEVLKLWIAYKFDTNFVDIIPQAERLKLSINIYKQDLNDPRDLAEDISSNPKGQWGSGKVVVFLDSIEKLPYCLGLIRQALEEQQ
ncbi:DUF262 and DUF1524 domain-containing protein [Helicobacter macacae]|uniref:DUF262 domain-containing protein n=1 Tax=Helicobacter macacae MIT 99-5501 TaxID=1357400 RepID=V8C6N6_9HELI|nr:DUF262 and DUF1524 domain-containing protein [Helicobacter macacae]ETD23009.1 hypothetical protein HMPREF2086_01456 [Helicobacter macacae MIT 99-5501]